MDPTSRVYIAGHNGLVGSAVARALARLGYRDVITRSRAMLDLRDSRALAQFLATVRPDAIFLAAARVGGIWANDAQPAEFIRDNLVIQANLALNIQFRHCTHYTATAACMP